MESGKIENNVAVVAESGSDQQFLLSLLQNAGYKPGTLDSDVNNSALQSLSAMVVCHRRNSLPHPDVPKGVGAQRVVVVSDCNSEQSIVAALEQGAHHYFDITDSPQVLQARLAAALRHHSQQAKRTLEVKPFRFNLERRNVYRDGKLINLSPKEYEFAYYLFANRHRVVVNSELMTSVWSLPSTMDARRIDTAACRVRRKMQLSDDSNGWRLRRIRRVGYELEWHGAEKEQEPYGSDSNLRKFPAASKAMPVEPVLTDIEEPGKLAAGGVI